MSANPDRRIGSSDDTDQGTSVCAHSKSCSAKERAGLLIGALAHAGHWSQSGQASAGQERSASIGHESAAQSVHPDEGAISGSSTGDALPNQAITRIATHGPRAFIYLSISADAGAIKSPPEIPPRPRCRGTRLIHCDLGLLAEHPQEAKERAAVPGRAAAR